MYSSSNDAIRESGWRGARPTGWHRVGLPSDRSGSEANFHYYSGRRTRPRLKASEKNLKEAIGGGNKPSQWPFSFLEERTKMSSTTSAPRASTAAESKLMSGAQILLECLVRENVDCIFGYPGGVTLPLYDAFYDHPIRHVLVRHEQNAAFAAEGYARTTGRVGVCCATSGPGATNLVTGLVDSMMDSIPVVAITGQVSTKLIGSDAFQEADTFGITRSCIKHNFMVKTVAEL